MLVHWRNDDITIDGINGDLTGRHIMKILAKDSEILTELREFFKELEHPNYEAYTDLDVLIRDAKEQWYPMGRDWRKLLPFILKDFPYLGKPEPSSTQQQASTSQQQLQIQLVAQLDADSTRGPKKPDSMAVRLSERGSTWQFWRNKQFRKEF